MSKHFCCCIPVRAGVFLFSLLQFLATGFAAGFLWFVLDREHFFFAIIPRTGSHFVAVILSGKTWDGTDYGGIDNTGRIAVGIAAGIFTLVALFALFGFVIFPFLVRSSILMFFMLLDSLDPSYAIVAWSRHTLYRPGPLSLFTLLHPASCSTSPTPARPCSRAARSTAMTAPSTSAHGKRSYTRSSLSSSP